MLVMHDATRVTAILRAAAMADYAQHRYNFGENKYKIPCLLSVQDHPPQNLWAPGHRQFSFRFLSLVSAKGQPLYLLPRKVNELNKNELHFTMAIPFYLGKDVPCLLYMCFLSAFASVVIPNQWRMRKKLLGASKTPVGSKSHGKEHFQGTFGLF